MSEPTADVPGSPIRRTTVLGAVAVALVTAGIAQALLRNLFFDLQIIDGRVIAVVFHLIVVIAPVVFFLAWRITVERKVRLEAMLRDSEALREELTSMLVHDLKNPVVSAGLALGALSASEHIESAGSDEEKELLAIARESLTRLEKMIGDLLDIARAEAGEIPLSSEEVDLGELVRNAVRESSVQFSDARIELAIDVPDHALCARVDRDRIRRVIDNLQANAIRSTPAGGRIAVRVVGDGREAVITIADNGSGIPESIRERLFEKFGQVQASREGQRMSAGLGLYYCKLVVDAHGGRIWVESSEGRGSVFGFALPLASTND
jgi:signal transduction histidine kinase